MCESRSILLYLHSAALYRTKFQTQPSLRRVVKQKKDWTMNGVHLIHLYPKLCLHNFIFKSNIHLKLNAPKIELSNSSGKKIAQKLYVLSHLSK